MDKDIFRGHCDNCDWDDYLMKAKVKIDWSKTKMEEFMYKVCPECSNTLNYYTHKV